MGFTDDVRDELAHTPLGGECCRRAETSAMVRLGGWLHLTEAGPGWVVTLTSGAATRRLHAALTQLLGSRPQVQVHQPTALRAGSYRVSLARPVLPALAWLGVMSRDGQPVDAVPAQLVATAHDSSAYLRGCLMVAASLSDPRSAPHLELRAPGQGTAGGLRRLLVRCGGRGARAAQRSDGWRVHCKSGEAIGAVLARAGAHHAFLAWDAERLRRELRGNANRAANADRANLGRAVTASTRQVAMIEAVVAAQGWHRLPSGLRTTALARLANPQASLAELGALHDPPVAKATVHRRLVQLAAFVEGLGRPGGG
jgi:DNA-binding protein WhiA